MTSLRSRLILGVAIVALVPLALSMTLLSRRIEDTVRQQASQRLSAALATLEAGLAADGKRIAGQLGILAKDPALKRLYLLHPAGSRDLAEDLAERRFLLGLDFLHVADTSGAVIADAAAAATARDAPLEVRALPGRGAHGPAIETLADGSATVLSASAPILYAGRPVGLLRGGLALNAVFLERLKSASGVDILFADPGGRVLASTLGDSLERTGTGDEGGLILERVGAARVEIGGISYWSRSVLIGAPLAGPAGINPLVLHKITGLVPTAAADRTIAALQLTSLLLGLFGLGVAIALGVLWSSQVSRPVEQLAEVSQRIARGEWDEPIRMRSVRELQTLVAAFERMRADLGDYRQRLVTSERQAAWGQMARMVAHEIKNPLTPIAVSVADLKRSFERERADFPEILDQAVKTTAAEVDALKRILQEFADFARLPPPQLAPCTLADLISGLATLYGREVEARRLELPSPTRNVRFTADQGQMRQALVNLIQNGLDATEPGGRVTVAARAQGGTLEISVADTGPGLTPERQAGLFVPGLTTKAHGSGLGLTIVQRIVNDHGGSIAVESEPGRGTTFHMRLPLEPGA
jgi:two-component system nitrogen regulation sensor histidine kinase NtrY